MPVSLSSTKLIRLLVWCTIVVSLASPQSSVADTAPPQIELKTFPLRGSPNSVDMSPDEKFVVTEWTFRSELTAAGTREFTEVVQIWDFQEDRLAAEMRLEPVAVKPVSKGYFRDPLRGQRIVRFSPDGNRVVALIGLRIFILRAHDLTEILTLELSPPEDQTRTFRGHVLESKPEIRAMEVSPKSDLVAVLWAIGELHGRIDVRDLASGATVASWDAPFGWIGFARGFVWHPDGKLLLLAIPNAMPCMSPSNQPDVFAFDAVTGAIKYRFTTGLLTGSIAATADGRVFAVDENCLGVFANHNPKLRVFDIATGKKIYEVSGRGSGVRYLVSASADGSRFLAFTGIVKMQFDWSDAVPRDKRVDGTFSVWRLSDYAGIATSQDVAGLNPYGLRLSPKGGYAVSAGKNSAVYRLPPP